jgi:restriction endonuclease S subunit
MHMTIPPTDTQKNIEAIKRAADAKRHEVELAQRKLTELQAELRGVNIALETLEGKPTPRAFSEL